MHRKFTRLAWFIFAVLACASWYAYFSLTGVPGLFDALFGMALLNVVIGVWIINYAPHRRRTMLLVAAAFLTGHWERCFGVLHSCYGISAVLRREKV